MSALFAFLLLLGASPLDALGDPEHAPDAARRLAEPRWVPDLAETVRARPRDDLAAAWALVALSRIPGPEVDELLAEDRRMQPKVLVRAAQIARADSLQALLDLDRGRQLLEPLRVRRAAALIAQEDLEEVLRHPDAQWPAGTLAQALKTVPPARLAEIMAGSEDLGVRQEAAAHLATQGRPARRGLPPRWQAHHPEVAAAVVEAVVRHADREVLVLPSINFGDALEPLLQALTARPDAGSWPMTEGLEALARGGHLREMAGVHVVRALPQPDPTRPPRPPRQDAHRLFLHHGGGQLTLSLQVAPLDERLTAMVLAVPGEPVFRQVPAALFDNLELVIRPPELKVVRASDGCEPVPWEGEPERRFTVGRTTQEWESWRVEARTLEPGEVEGWLAEQGMAWDEATRERARQAEGWTLLGLRVWGAVRGPAPVVSLRTRSEEAVLPRWVTPPHDLLVYAFTEEDFSPPGLELVEQVDDLEVRLDAPPTITGPGAEVWETLPPPPPSTSLQKEELALARAAAKAQVLRLPVEHRHDSLLAAAEALDMGRGPMWTMARGTGDREPVVAEGLVGMEQTRLQVLATNPDGVEWLRPLRQNTCVRAGSGGGAVPR